jgi:hypothetical protein
MAHDQRPFGQQFADARRQLKAKEASPKMRDQISSKTSNLPALRDAEVDVLMDIPSANFVLHSYVLRVTRCQCISCGHIATTSQLYELYAPVRGTGRRLRAILSEPARDRTIAVEQMPITGTRLCHECIATSSHLPSNEELRRYGARFATPYRGPSNFDPVEKPAKVKLADIPVEDLDI